MTFNVSIKVIPNAKKKAISYKDNILKIYVTVPPVDGKANKKAKEFLSDILDIHSKNLEIVKGLKSKRKIISISGITEDIFWEKIKEWSINS